MEVSIICFIVIIYSLGIRDVDSFNEEDERQLSIFTIMFGTGSVITVKNYNYRYLADSATTIFHRITSK